MTRVLEYAERYVALGYSVIPVKADGSKSPLIPGWREFSERLPNENELHHWFGNGTVAGIGIPCGPASGCMAVLDFETGDVWDRWRANVPSDTVDFLEGCPVVRTPSGGVHVWVRLPEPVPGTVLARDKDKGVLVEIRGNGHQVLAPGCPLSCHKTGLPYEFIQKPTETRNPIPLGVFARWCDLAASLNEYKSESKPPVTYTPRDRSPSNKDPGSDFNQRGIWEETGLFSSGWAWVRQYDNDRGSVRRPGKSDGLSGTVGMVTSRQHGWPLFYVFTSNGGIFEHEASYDRFGVYARLQHRGDFKAAAKALGERGYGEQTRRSSGNSGGTGIPRSDPAGNGSDPSGPKPDRAISPFLDTDVANGRRFVAEHGDVVRFVADWNRWVVYDGKRWAVDKSETLVQRLAKETTDRMALEAAGLIGTAAKRVAEAGESDGKDVAEKELTNARRGLAHAKKSQAMKAIRWMLDCAASEPLVNIQQGREWFDLHPYLLNVQNGTVDLRSGVLRPHAREDFITRVCPIGYYPDAPRAGYQEFLKKTFHGKPAVAAYVRELSGYVATGETCDHSFHVFFGDGSNGKGVLMLLWTHVLGEGEYAHTAEAELLVNDGRDRHPTERVGLRGARLVVCSESKEGGRLDEEKMKRLTSDDKMKARGMGQDFFEFTPTHKLVLQTNHKPRVRGTDHGTNRRLRLVPFAVKFWKESDKRLSPDAVFDPIFQADPTLEERLQTSESEGVLADMITHARQFYANGKQLNPPSEVMETTVEYLKAEDIIGQFLDARVTHDPDGMVKASTLYTEFKKWAAEEGHDDKRLPRVTTFGTEVKRRFDFTRNSVGVCYHISANPIV